MKVSVLFNEPKLLKWLFPKNPNYGFLVSVLFNEPKLLKSIKRSAGLDGITCFSALQRAEIAEIQQCAVH